MKYLEGGAITSDEKFVSSKNCPSSGQPQYKVDIFGLIRSANGDTFVNGIFLFEE